MNKRELPPFRQTDLRDPAGDQVVDRVWERIEADLIPPSPAMPARRNWYALGAAAAVVLAFGGGVLLGTQGWFQASVQDQATLKPSIDPVVDLDVLAAGTRGRTFALPGGGNLTLSPGSTAELINRSDRSVSIRLVQGEASVDTVGASTSHALAIVVGDATVSTQAGATLRVKRDTDRIDVSVSDGSVDIASPAGTRQLRRGERAELVALPTVPTVSSAVAVRSLHTRMASKLEGSPQADPPKTPMPQPPDWRTRSNAGDLDEAFQLLKRQPGGVDGAISTARSAAELMDIHDVALSGGDGGAAMHALVRIVDTFPDDAYAQIAAFKLGDMYRNAGRPDMAQLYLERAQRFNGALAEDALCKQFRTAVQKDDAVRMAKAYLLKYPDGRCKDEAERIARGEDPVMEEPPTADAGAPLQADK